MKSKYNILLLLLLTITEITLFANNLTLLEKQLNSILVDNRYFEGVPELGIISTSSGTTKFQKIFIEPNSGEIFKVGKKGEGPNEFRAFPNIFSDGNFLYANDMGGKKIIVYNPANKFSIVDIITTKNLPFPVPRVIGKFNNVWIVATLNMVKWKASKKQYSFELILWTSKDLKQVEKLLTIANLSKNAKENALRVTKIFLIGLKTLAVNNNHLIIIDKQPDKTKSQSEILVYSFNDKTTQHIKFNIESEFKANNATYRGFLGLNFNYYSIYYFEKEDGTVNTLVNTINLTDLTTTKYTFSTVNQTVFGSLGEKLILQDIVSEDINLQIVDSKKLLSLKY